MIARLRPERASRWWAFLLSLVLPGLGQAFNGEYYRGAGFAAAAIASAVPVEFTAYVYPGWPAWLVFLLIVAGVALGFLIAIAAGVDAFQRRAGADRRRLLRWRRYLVYAAFIVALAFPVEQVFGWRSWSTYRTPSGSMEPTVLAGDYWWGVENAYADRAPERGDVAVFKLPADPSIDFVKRVIGLPGDRVQVKSGVVYINDVAVRREVRDLALYPSRTARHRYRETLPNGVSYRIIVSGDDLPAENTGLFTVPPGSYFMMGDNRDDSADSRVDGSGVGFVPAENFVARAGIVYFSSNRSTRPWQIWEWPAAIRWRRIGLGLDGS